MDVEKEKQEYQAAQAWLKGEKPPAAGRTWRRVAAVVVPKVLREPLRRRFGETAGDVLGFLGVAMGPLLMLGVMLGVLDLLTAEMEGLAGAAPSAIVGPEQAVLMLIKDYLRPIAGGLFCVMAFLVWLRAVFFVD